MYIPIPEKDIVGVAVNNFSGKRGVANILL